ncbi:hypothetical protein BDB00DRAFT_943013 [Zychaea mexicana]|uniref:uncharacterized protein n=1 Tax=Zychaea mexicana TaxID=64656 RepID=UPI0022FE066A|nr:uncharacterized protein BDB00DRAFT_943013 [Zychaea mexicana]KAI9484599.1 hypothetical protein BDB00DRAFT_943013 [Zychaea mexicana]
MVARILPYIAKHVKGLTITTLDRDDGRPRNPFATIHVAHYYLTMQLLPLLIKSAPSRIAYDILITRELTKRLESKGIRKVYVNCNHPGVAKSDLSRHAIEKNSILSTVLGGDYVGKRALTQLYLATSPEVENKNIMGKCYILAENQDL